MTPRTKDGALAGLNKILLHSRRLVLLMMYAKCQCPSTTSGSTAGIRTTHTLLDVVVEVEVHHRPVHINLPNRALSMHQLPRLPWPASRASSNEIQ